MHLKGAKVSNDLLHLIKHDAVILWAKRLICLAELWPQDMDAFLMRGPHMTPGFCEQPKPYEIKLQLFNGFVAWI